MVTGNTRQSRIIEMKAYILDGQPVVKRRRNTARRLQPRGRDAAQSNESLRGAQVILISTNVGKSGWAMVARLHRVGTPCQDTLPVLKQVVSFLPRFATYAGTLKVRPQRLNDAQFSARRSIQRINTVFR